jgi:thiamine kinase-like enzyme
MQDGREERLSPDRQEHQREVNDFLRKHLSLYDWKFSLPQGSGKESYFAHGFKRTYFVKVGVHIERYRAMADIGLTPPVILHGHLESGPSIIVQLAIQGRRPSRADYRQRLVDVAELVREIHGHRRIKDVLQPASSDLYSDAGMRALHRLREKWEPYKAQVPQVADFVDDSLMHLVEQVSLLSGNGLVAAHGDICNANWLFAADGKIYMLDFDSMSMDDPALDLGALLWWYYPPQLRQPFLEAAGYRYEEEFKHRMQIRMAMHCLDITLPRQESYDQLDAEHYEQTLRDFRAILQGKENPQGYE